MEFIAHLFGEGKDLSTLQMCFRAITIFIIALFLIRISGRRSFGMKSPFDNTIVILLGAILSRAVVGASAFIPTVSAGLVIVLMHRLFAWLSIRNKKFGEIIKGRNMVLYENGKIFKKNMEKALISDDDLIESIHTKAQIADLNSIKAAYMERSGEISVIRKEEAK